MLTAHQWLRQQPHDHWCAICKAWVTKWHEHHGPSPEKRHKPEKVVE